MSNLATDTVRECVQHIASGKLTSEEVVEHCYAQIDKSEADVRAWAHTSKEQSLNEARARDDVRRRGEPLGSLHGIPVGLKDIYDTAAYPTEYGSPIHSGRQPEADCAVVERLIEAGAVIMGKTVTTEFAFMHPSVTRNPHNLDYSPGGSSSGSAAAVAAGHVPLALGSQTNGSVIRPASFCGVYGYKPSAGMVSRRGVLETSPTLDNVGVFGRNLEDMASLVDALSGYDAADIASYNAPKPPLVSGYDSDVPVTPALAWIDMPYSDLYSADVNDGFAELLDALGNMVERIPAPESFKALIPCHKVIHEYEIARALDTEISNHWDDIGDTIKPILTEAKNISDEAYSEAIEVREASMSWFKQFFNDFDAVLTPSAPGEAPLMGSTGNPICSTVWTLCGLPCISMPLLESINNLPLGVQLVGANKEDDRLFRTARYVLSHLQNDSRG